MDASANCCWGAPGRAAHDQQVHSPCTLGVPGSVMRQPPGYTSWKVTCRSPEEAQALRQWLSSRIDLDRVRTDTARVTPDGVEQVQTVRHRLGDSFASIR